MSIYEAGFNPRPEDEREQESWADPLDGEMPGRPPRRAEDPDDWTRDDDEEWTEDMAGAEYWLNWDGWFEDSEA